MDIDALEERIDSDEHRRSDLTERIEALESTRGTLLLESEYDGETDNDSLEQVNRELQNLRDELEHIEARLPAARERLEELYEIHEADQLAAARDEHNAAVIAWYEAKLAELEAMQIVEDRREGVRAAKDRLDAAVGRLDSLADTTQGYPALPRGTIAEVKAAIESKLENLKGQDK